MNFRVGQKVVCVSVHMNWRTRLSYLFRPPRSSLPELGSVYTVANSYFDDQNQTTMIELVELPAPWDRGWLAGFNAACFRPAVERKTDISMFTRMLTPAPRVKERTPCASS
jgi:hypothetical protein